MSPIRAADPPNQWDFWLIGTDVDRAVRNLYTDPSNIGLTNSTRNYRLWVLTWGQLLDRAERRIEAFRSALDLASTNETSTAYLHRRHAEFIPDLGPT